MEFNYHLIEEWPPLAWLTKCSVSSSCVDVYHGNQVEVRTSWFCEAVWDGPFADGNFDDTDIVFGSGGRLRDGQLVFVSSGTTVDRMQALKLKDYVLISNSLACLVKAADASIDRTHSRYFQDFESICHGLSNYKRKLQTSAGPIIFFYFNNIKWDGKSLLEIDKPCPTRDFSCFEKYRTFLQTSLEKISQNLSSKDRSNIYELSATLSSGYDTSAMVVLAKPFNLKEVFSIKESRSGLSDTGSEVAEILGLNQIFVERDAWQTKNYFEVPFLAADAKGEDVYFSGAEDSLKRKVVLTGYAAGAFWLNDSFLMNPDLMRRDQSGLPLTEYRLWAGFIHLPLAFLGSKQIEDFLKISSSSEMSPWDVGGDYNRPIQRRIVEEAGIPRNAFGVKKKAASILFYHRKSFLSPKSLNDFRNWLNQHSKDWWDKEEIPPLIVSRLWNSCLPFLSLFSLLTRAIAKASPSGLLNGNIRPFAEKMRCLARDEYLSRYVYPWSLEKAKERYSAGPSFQQDLKKNSNAKSNSPSIYLKY